MEYVIIYRDKNLDLRFKAVPKDYSYANINSSEVMSVLKYYDFIKALEQFREENNEAE